MTNCIKLSKHTIPEEETCLDLVKKKYLELNLKLKLK